jgi:hypothetical protein
VDEEFEVDVLLMESGRNGFFVRPYPGFSQSQRVSARDWFSLEVSGKTRCGQE